MPISQNPWVYNSSLLMGAIPTLIGLRLWFNPDASFDILGFPRPAEPASKKLADSLVMFIAARDLALGACTLAAWHSGNRRTLGLVLLTGTAMTVLDGLVQKRQMGEGMGVHWGFTPVGLGLSGAVLGWFD